jgi:glutathione S-transferase
MALELYHHNISVCAQKVRLVLAEKSIDWIGHHIDLVTGEQTDPAYLAIHPKGLVPALVHDGRAIIESTLICEYLDEVFPEPPMRPVDLVERARMRRWARLPDDGWHLACGSVSFAAAFARQIRANYDEAGFADRLAAMPDPARAERQRQILEHRFEVPFVQDAVRYQDRALADMEARLTESPWLAGDMYSLAEACIIPYVERLDRLGLSPMWQNARPHVADWFDRAQARPNYAEAITAFAPHGIDDQLKDRGEGVWDEVAPILDQAG